MFKKDTVFVLGAGVSVPFGFPSGGDLLQILTGRISPLHRRENEFRNQHEALKKALKKAAEYPHLVDEFVKKLRSSETRSIDTWLRYNRSFIEIGKSAIAAVIANAESQAKLDSHIDDDWFRWLFQAMQKETSSLNQLIDNRVTFITFNYDRLLEWKLQRAIFNSYSDTNDEKESILQTLRSKIIHVHGVLNYSTQGLDKSFGCVPLAQLVNFPPSPDQDDKAAHLGIISRELATGVRIIGETGQAKLVTAIQNRISTAISNANKIVFLGFHYDDDNMAILNVKAKAASMSWSTRTANVSRPIIGTAVGLGGGQQHDVMAHFAGSIMLGAPSETCVPFCNEYLSLNNL